MVPYSPVLSRKFQFSNQCGILCNSVKSIKHICKYKKKGSGPVAFALEKERDEVVFCGSGPVLEISSLEAVRRILVFFIHERYHTVFLLAVHFENGQHVYFTANNLPEKLSSTPQTFFHLCKADNFVETLLYASCPTTARWTAIPAPSNSGLATTCQLTWGLAACTM